MEKKSFINSNTSDVKYSPPCKTNSDNGSMLSIFPQFIYFY